MLHYNTLYQFKVFISLHADVKRRKTSFIFSDTDLALHYKKSLLLNLYGSINIRDVHKLSMMSNDEKQTYLISMNRIQHFAQLFCFIITLVVMSLFHVCILCVQLIQCT